VRLVPDDPDEPDDPDDEPDEPADDPLWLRWLFGSPCDD
jgi:hypothetical protein